jgi:hypothetical protein
MPENYKIAFMKSFFVIYIFLQFKNCSFNVIRVYELIFSDLFYIVQKKGDM